MILKKQPRLYTSLDWGRTTPSKTKVEGSPQPMIQSFLLQSVICQREYSRFAKLPILEMMAESHTYLQLHSYLPVFPLEMTL